MLAAGGKIGKSLAEADLVDKRSGIIAQAEGQAAPSADPDGRRLRQGVRADAEADREAGGGRGRRRHDPRHRPGYGEQLAEIMLKKAGTIVWNGPSACATSRPTT
jgi:3-phosphoglycerate kinase